VSRENRRKGRGHFSAKGGGGGCRCKKKSPSVLSLGGMGAKGGKQTFNYSERDVCPNQKGEEKWDAEGKGGKFHHPEKKVPKR